MSKVVEMRGIEKSFDKNYVLKKVDFSLAAGSIHALLGENGTGKSTLMNILGNIIPKDAGSINIFGKDIHDVGSENPVAFIHQELALVNDLSVYENLFLGRELRKGPFLDHKKMIEETKKYLEQLNIEINPKTLVKDLNPSYKQITEILRALMKNAKVIIMDEPTTSLTDIEINHIFTIMRRLQKQGVSIIFISHKLNEVLEICDAYTIMRDGIVVASGAVTAETTELELSQQMVGKEFSNSEIYYQRPIGEEVLTLNHLSKDREYQNVSMTVKKGEIVGVTGLLGDGRSELFSTVAGANYPYEGDIIISQQKVTMKTTTTAKKHNIAYIPKNRKENGIVKDLTIEENMLLPILNRLATKGLKSRSKMDEKSEHFINMLNIKVADKKNLINSLSGGNQQKVVLAKGLSMDPAIVILDNPTQGVDVGAKHEIYKEILALSEKGISFVILSSEIPEIKKLCDRVYVMFHGQIRQEFSHDEINEEDIMLISTGGTLGGEK